MTMFRFKIIYGNRNSYGCEFEYDKLDTNRQRQYVNIDGDGCPRPISPAILATS